MTVLDLTSVSRWYGNVVAVNDVSMRLGPGITGLLGPNGAGKSTLLNLMAGFLEPSSGGVTIDGVPMWRNVAAYRQVGIVPEGGDLYEATTGWRFVLANAKLHGLADPAAAARAAIATVDMEAAQDRVIGTYSKGMKQRIKMASAIVHEPSVLLLDEPFNGMDPRQRLHLMELLRARGEQGCTVVFSSHILEEVEELATSIEVIVAGRHAATGDFREIRRLMTHRPHEFVVRSSDDRALAAALMEREAVDSVELVPGAAGRPALLQARTRDYAAFSRALPGIAAEHGIRLREVQPADESLEHVFSYLVGT